MSRTKEIQVGIMVLAALGITLWGVTWLKELSLTRKVRTWHVEFPQTGGLATSDEVQVNGLRKGNVAGIKLAGDRVVVDLALTTDIVLTRDSRVAIRNLGLMGEKVVAVDLRTTGAPYSERDTIAGIYELGIPEVMAQMGPTVDALQSLTAELNTLAGTIQKDGKLKETLLSFRSTSEELNAAVRENRVLLRESMTNLSAASRTAKALTTDREERLKQTLDSFERSAVGLERLTGKLDSLRGVLQKVSSKVDSGEGTLGRLVNDPKLYDDARASVEELQKLIADIKKNPKKYLHMSIF